jgi:twitching motility protein PilT
MNNQKLQQIITDASAALASDVHLLAGMPPAFRIHGEVLVSEEEPVSAEEVTTMAFSLLSPAQRESFEKQWEYSLAFTHPVAGRVRATLYRRHGHPELSLRLCGDRVPDRNELGLPERLDDVARHRAGLILIAGPSGSGRTTTINYLVDLLNRERGCKILTLEDPIEYVHEPRRALLVQQEIHGDSQSLARAMRHARRQDADVLVIGDLPAGECAQAALEAAAGGPLVIAAVRSPNTVCALESLVSAGVDAHASRHLVRCLAQCLAGAFAQVLMPAHDHSRRVLAWEFLPGSQAVRELIALGEFERLRNELQAGVIADAVSLDHSLIRFEQAGVISMENLRARASHPERLALRLEAH